MSSVPVPRPVNVSARHRVSDPVSHAGFLAGEMLLLVLLVALAYAVKVHPGPLPGDVTIEKDVQHALLPHKLVTQVVEAVSTLNWPVPSVITLAIITIAFLFLRRWLDIVVVIAIAAAGDETNYLISQWIKRPRPTGHGLHILSKIQHFYSFPSGHVVHAMAVFGLFLFLTTQIRRSIHPLIKWLVRLLMIVGIVLMPISRMLEGEHWPSDVLGGLLYGGIWLMIGMHVYTWARYRWPRLLARDER